MGQKLHSGNSDHTYQSLKTTPKSRNILMVVYELDMRPIIIHYSFITLHTHTTFFENYDNNQLT